MIAVNANDDDDYDYDHLIYDDELYPKGTLTPKTPKTPGTTGTPGTPLVIIDSPPWRITQGRAIKALPPKQMLPRLRILPPQVQAGNTYENLLDEIRQVTYSLYWVR